jgi:hypothetical protein
MHSWYSGSLMLALLRYDAKPLEVYELLVQWCDGHAQHGGGAGAAAGPGCWRGGGACELDAGAAEVGD